MDKGDAMAQYRLGVMNLEGRGLDEQSDVEGFKWLRRAANQGLSEAIYDLAMLYLEGRGCVKDESSARY